MNEGENERHEKNTVKVKYKLLEKIQNMIVRRLQKKIFVRRKIKIKRGN